MKRETYQSARIRLLAALAANGFTIRPGLKVPWAEPPDGSYRLWFRPQAVYLNEHSLWIDIRGMTLDELFEHIRIMTLGRLP